MVSLTRIDIDDEALETAVRTRAAAHQRYFELAQEWNLEGAEASHQADKEAFRR